MPKFLVQGSYTSQGAAGLLKEGGSSRQETVTALIEGLGGSVESWYYGYGKTDVYVIADAPDDEAMVAVALAVGASGAVNLTTTVLLEPSVIDGASKKLVNYRAPGA